MRGSEILLLSGNPSAQGISSTYQIKDLECHLTRPLRGHPPPHRGEGLFLFKIFAYLSAEMQTHFFSREKKRVSDPKENRRGVPFRPGPPNGTRGSRPLDPLQILTTDNLNNC